MKNPEFEPESKKPADESGYSEKKQAKDIESQFDFNQRKRNAQVTAGHQQKKLATYHELSATIADLMNQYVSYIEEDLHRAQKLLEQIKELEKQRSEIFKSLLS